MVVLQLQHRPSLAYTKQTSWHHSNCVLHKILVREAYIYYLHIFHSDTDLNFSKVLWSSFDDGVHAVAHREGMVPVVKGHRAVVSAHSEGEPEETVKVKL